MDCSHKLCLEFSTNQTAQIQIRRSRTPQCVDYQPSAKYLLWCIQKFSVHYDPYPLIRIKSDYAPAAWLDCNSDNMVNIMASSRTQAQIICLTAQGHDKSTTRYYLALRTVWCHTFYHYLPQTTASPHADKEITTITKLKSH